MEIVPPVSIIIPTLNEEKYLPLLLDSLKRISAPLDIIVVDGNSEDDTVQVVEQYRSYFTNPSSLRLIRSAERGISLQRNLGAAVAKHAILIFCDADIVVPSPEAHTGLLSEFIKGRYVAANPRLVPIESDIHYRMFHTTWYFAQRFLLLFGRPYLAGGYLITTQEAFLATGEFDVNVVLGEDVHYSLRVGKIGQCAVFSISYQVSARRLVKYGHGWLFTQIPNIFRFLFTGRLVSESIYYPFGEYSGQKAHHVTNNKGKS